MRPQTNGTPAPAGTHGGALPLASTGGADYINRTWVVSQDLAGTVAQLADELQVTHSALVRELLRHALADVRSGRLDLQTRPSRWEIVGVSDG